MVNKNKNIAIIPARGGSKRIPRKNIKEFHGKPIIAYTIEAALKSNLFDKVIVSTEDEEIAHVAKEYGAEIPFMRPKELSDDLTHIGPVIKYTLSRLKEMGYQYEYLCSLYATSPFLTAKFLQEGFEVLEKSDAAMSFAATTMPCPIQRTFKITSNNRCEMFWPENYFSRSQDLEEAYQDAVMFNWNKLNFQLPPNTLFYGDYTIPIVIPRYYVQDIDTIEDWENAEMMYEALKKSNLIT